MKRYVILHREHGVFIGTSLGLAFFSLNDCVGQWVAVTFESEEKANELIGSLALDKDGFTVSPVETTEHHADALVLMQAGVPKHMVEPLIANERPMAGTIH